jgi:hypothetical protein
MNEELPISQNSGGTVMIVDCMTCPVRGQRCDDCAVTVLLAGTMSSGPQVPLGTGSPVTDLRLDAAERRVVSMFVGAGLVERSDAARLRARQESVDQWNPVWDVG